jgi:hypothetical protein
MHLRNAATGSSFGAMVWEPFPGQAEELVTVAARTRQNGNGH